MDYYVNSGASWIGKFLVFVWRTSDSAVQTARRIYFHYLGARKEKLILLPITRDSRIVWYRAKLDKWLKNSGRLSAIGFVSEEKSVKAQGDFHKIKKVVLMFWMICVYF